MGVMREREREGEREMKRGSNRVDCLDKYCNTDGEIFPLSHPFNELTFLI
jgi:hypothetical protein